MPEETDGKNKSSKESNKKSKDQASEAGLNTMHRTTKTKPVRPRCLRQKLETLDYYLEHQELETMFITVECLKTITFQMG